MDKRVPSTIKFVKSFSNDGINNAGTFLYVDQATGLYYVKKRVPNRRIVSYGFDREVEVARTIRGHSKVNHLEWSGQEKPDPCRGAVGVLWMDYCDMGPLSGFHDRNAQKGNLRLPQDFLLKCLADLSSALSWLTTGANYENGYYRPGPSDWNPVTHNDLHDSNIFMTSVSSDPNFPAAVLGDFGNATSALHRRQARQKPALARADDFRLDHNPERDVHCLGRCFLYLAGDRAVYKNGFSSRALERLVSQGLSRPLAQVLRTIFVSQPDALTLARTVYNRREEYRRAQGGDRPLPSYVFPRMDHRQPRGRNFPRANAAAPSTGAGLARTGTTRTTRTQRTTRTRGTTRTKLSPSPTRNRPRRGAMPSTYVTETRRPGGGGGAASTRRCAAQTRRSGGSSSSSYGTTRRTTQKTTRATTRGTTHARTRAGTMGTTRPEGPIVFTFETRVPGMGTTGTTGMTGMTGTTRMTGKTGTTRMTGKTGMTGVVGKTGTTRRTRKSGWGWR